MASKVRAIAFYLPQFYPTKENDEWWEPGFTEWTNVARTTPLFPGHYQPRIPRDLGFYDLRVQETRIKQAHLAEEAGIEGFCYWHYWFGNGKRLLSEVFDEVVKSGRPDFPFCLCWANHSWYSKTWDPNLPDQLLMEQTYPGESDYIDHFNAMLPAFRDSRYMTVNGRQLFGIFEPRAVDISTFSKVWNKLASDNGLPGFHFFAFCQGYDVVKEVDVTLFNSVVYDPLLTIYDKWKASEAERRKRENLLKKRNPYTVSYDEYVTKCIGLLQDYPLSIPCIEPDFDHTPRSGYRARILVDSTPEKWGKLCRETAALVADRPNQERIVFVKAWNEWGEGNYLEPDRKWGRAYLEEMSKAFKD
jgi:hypothetical protein